MVIGYQVTLSIDDDGRTDPGIDAIAADLPAARGVRHQPPGVYIGDGRCGNIHGIRIAQRRPPGTGIPVANGRQQLRPDQDHDEGRRQPDDNRLEQEYEDWFESCHVGIAALICLGICTDSGVLNALFSSQFSMALCIMRD